MISISGMSVDDPIGAAWLAEKFGFRPIGRLPALSRIGGRRTTTTEEGIRFETYIEAMRPKPDAASHLQFHLRHETVHLEFIERLFVATGAEPVQEWINREPTGQYARRAAFLYEWLMGEQLQAPPGLGGNYVDAIDARALVAANPDKAMKVQRWRVNDNLPGTRHFCPILPATRQLANACKLDVPALLTTLTEEFGEDLLMRAATWMTVRESKASFTIEGEADQTTRIQRFADVMTRMTGQGEVPFSNEALAELQGQILGPNRTLHTLGVRQSPVFVGETINYNEVVHYVAPPAADVEAMLDGVKTFLDRTHGQSQILRAAVAAFAFVYIHPLADGNGRVHRFLINDILRRDGAIKEPMILPVSAVITADAGQRREYDRTLDHLSAPLMRALADSYQFEKEQTTYLDGVVSNFSFDGEIIAQPYWRYPDLTAHVSYLAQIVSRTITEEMREESRYLRTHQRARVALKEVVEMPDHQADRLLRSLDQNSGKLSGVLAKEMPILEKPGIWAAILDAVAGAREQDEQPDLLTVQRYRP